MKRTWGGYNEFQLANLFEVAMRSEDYKTCAIIKEEVDKRMKYGLLDKNFMNGFRRYNPKTQRFEGKPKFSEWLNGLFDGYKYPED